MDLICYFKRSSMCIILEDFLLLYKNLKNYTFINTQKILKSKRILRAVGISAFSSIIGYGTRIRDFYGHSIVLSRATNNNCSLNQILNWSSKYPKWSPNFFSSFYRDGIVLLRRVNIFSKMQNVKISKLFHNFRKYAQCTPLKFNKRNFVNHLAYIGNYLITRRNSFYWIKMGFFIFYVYVFNFVKLFPYYWEGISDL